MALASPLKDFNSQQLAEMQAMAKNLFEITAFSNIHPCKSTDERNNWKKEIEKIAEFYVKHRTDIENGGCFMRNTDLPRSIIGKHIIFDQKGDEKICEGSMKDGFHAIQPHDSSANRLALKTKSMSSSYNQICAKREKIILDKLKGIDGVVHPCCIADQENSQYIIANYYQWKDLMTFVQKKTKLNDVKKDYMAFRCMTTLFEIHNAKVILRDIKMDNLVVKEKNGHYIADFTDFGLSCIETKNRQDPMFSDLYSAVGSPLYLPPENYRNVGEGIFRIPASPAWDIWSMGIVFHILYQNKYPIGIDEFVESEEPFHVLLPQFCRLVGQIQGPLYSPNQEFKGPFGNQIKEMLNGNPKQRPTSKMLAENMFDIFVEKHPDHIFSQHAKALQDFFPKRVICIIFSYL